MFQTLLTQGISGLDGALGAMFGDWEGESVEIASRDASRDDLKVIGAYQAIFLSRIKKICHELQIGPPEQFKLALSDVTILSCLLKDGYYVLLLLRRGANEGLAWRQLSSIRERLLEEI